MTKHPPLQYNESSLCQANDHTSHHNQLWNSRKHNYVHDLLGNGILAVKGVSVLHADPLVFISLSTFFNS